MAAEDPPRFHWPSPSDASQPFSPPPHPSFSRIPTAAPIGSPQGPSPPSARRTPPTGRGQQKHSRKPTGLGPSGIRQRFPIKVSQDSTGVSSSNEQPPPVPDKSHSRLTSQNRFNQVTPQSATFTGQGSVYGIGSRRATDSRGDRHGSMSFGSDRYRDLLSTRRLVDVQPSDGDISGSDADSDRNRRATSRRMASHSSRLGPSNLGSMDELPDDPSQELTGRTRTRMQRPSLAETTGATLTPYSEGLLHETSERTLRADSLMTLVVNRRASDEVLVLAVQSAQAMVDMRQELVSLVEGMRDTGRFTPSYYNTLVGVFGEIDDAMDELRRVLAQQEHSSSPLNPGREGREGMARTVGGVAVRMTELVEEVVRGSDVTAAFIPARVLRRLHFDLRYHFNEIRNAGELYDATPYVREHVGAGRQGAGGVGGVAGRSFDSGSGDWAAESREDRQRETIRRRRQGMTGATSGQVPRTASGNIDPNHYPDRSRRHGADSSREYSRLPYVSDVSRNPSLRHMINDSRSISRATTLVNNHSVPPSARSYLDNPTPLTDRSGAHDSLDPQSASDDTAADFPEEPQFHQIWVVVRDTSARAPEIVNHCIQDILTTMTRSRTIMNHEEMRHIPPDMSHDLQAFLTGNELVHRKAITMPLVDPAEYSGVNFWQLVANWWRLWSNLFKLVGITVNYEEGNQRLHWPVLEPLRDINFAFSRSRRLVAASPWEQYAKETLVNEVSNTPIVANEGDGFPNSVAATSDGHRQNGSSDSTVSGLLPSIPSSVNLNSPLPPMPPTPLSAALGQAAQATISNPSGRLARSTTVASNSTTRSQRSLHRTRTGSERG